MIYDTKIENNVKIIIYLALKKSLFKINCRFVIIKIIKFKLFSGRYINKIK